MAERKWYRRPGQRRIVCGKWVESEPDYIPVRVLAKAEGWALVRRPNCMPFAVKLTQLFEEAPAGVDQPQGGSQ